MGVDRPVGELPDPDRGGTTSPGRLSVTEAAAAFRALQAEGLAIPYPTNSWRNGWRLDTDSMAAATGRDNAQAPTRNRPHHAPRPKNPPDTPLTPETTDDTHSASPRDAR